MIHAQADKSVVVLKPVSVATDATQTGLIDTLGYDYCSIDISLDSTSALTTNPTVLKVAEGDTTSSYTDITALVGDGTGGFTIASSSTDTPQVSRMDIDLKGRKRYLKFFITAGTTAQLAAATARLSRAAVPPSSLVSSSANHVIV